MCKKRQIAPRVGVRYLKAMAVALFDLDKTLICANSARLWVQYEVRHGTVSRWQAARAMAWLMRYKLGATQLDGAIRLAIGTLRGSSEAALRSRLLDFYRTEVRHLYRPGARDAVVAHRRRGDRLVLLTSTSVYLAEAVCAELGFDDCLSTRLEVTAQGELTGRPIEPICFGAGKLHLAAVWAQQQTQKLADCAFYTDSASDLPVLQAVGKPIAVNPDPRLRLRARQQGWTIVDWGRPGNEKQAMCAG